MDYKRKLKENEKIDKFLDLARRPKKPRNMKETVIPIISEALGTVSKNMGRETMNWR